MQKKKQKEIAHEISTGSPVLLFFEYCQQRKVAKETGIDILRIFQSHSPSGKRL